MDENLQLDVGNSLMDGPYLFDSQFTGQHDTREA